MLGFSCLQYYINTKVSLWTTVAATQFNYIYLTDLDTLIVAKGAMLYKFAYGNNTPIWSIAINNLFNVYYNFINYVLSNDGQYLYCFIKFNRIIKVRISDGVIMWEHAVGNKFDDTFWNVYMSYENSDGELFGVRSVDSQYAF